MQTLGQSVRAGREAKGWTQRQLGDRVGASESHIANVESGRRGVSGRLRFQLATALELRPSEVYGHDLEAAYRRLLRERKG